jgi:hypothetical protein
MAGSARPGKCTFISLVGGARLQSAAHPFSGPALFEVKWFSAIVFNDLQVSRWLASEGGLHLPNCSVDSASDGAPILKLVAPLVFQRLPAAPSK